MEQIREYFEQTVSMTDKDWQFFSSRLVQQKFPKGTLLLQSGQTENYLSFIEKGIVRFYVPEAETEITFSFSFANEFVSAYDSFLTQDPCRYDVETLVETILWRLTYKDLQDIYAATAIGNTIGRYAGESLFLRNLKREMSLLIESAEQRYLNLLRDQPHLLQNIPLKYIATYIGITPQALSRIRRRIY